MNTNMPSNAFDTDATQTQVNSSVKKSRFGTMVRNYRWVWFTLCMLFLVFLTLVLMSTFVTTSPQAATVDTAPRLGTLYLSMAKEAPEGFTAPVTSYSYTPGVEGAVFESFLDLEIIPTLQTTFINEADDFFFVYAPSTPHQVADFLLEGEDTIVQTSGLSNIALSNFTNGGIEHMLPEDNSLVGERSLAWSLPKKSLAFAAQQVSIEDDELATTTDAVLRSAQTWGVYVVDLETKRLEYISEGFAPQWSPDGSSLIFLRVDGIYQYVLDTKELIHVVAEVPFGTSSQMQEMFIEENMNMDVTADGTRLVVSSPNQQALLFFDIKSWDTFRIEVSQDIAHRVGRSEQYYWPTFAPDGAHVAVQTTDRLTTGEEVNPRLEIISIPDGMIVDTKSFDMFDFNYAFIDDWQI